MNIRGRKVMNFSKNLIIIVFLLAIISAFTFADALNTVSADNSSGGNSVGTPGTTGSQTWIAYNTSNVQMTQLTANITVIIKNIGSHVEYFKISQIYSGTTPPMNFTVVSHPGAVMMIDPVNPEGDWGWEIQPGETKTVSFKVDASGVMGNDPGWIGNPNAVSNTSWPLIPDMGLYTSWFMPDEIQTLNPDLQLKSWIGIFTFTATNLATYPVAGIIRGPIIPTASKLTYSNPLVTFQDTSIAPETNVAAWNIHLTKAGSSNDHESFIYTYQWPLSGNGSNIGKGTSSVFAPNNSTNNTTTVPSQNTGIPYGLLALAAVMVTAGVVYAKFLR